ncbi:MAG: hypothetical protein ACXW02_03435 [Halobacteriota archaeon]
MVLKIKLHFAAQYPDLTGLRPEQEIIVGFGLGYPDVTYYRTTPREDVEVIWK